MRDRDFNLVRRKIEALLAFWKTELGVSRWRLTAEYCREGELVATGTGMRRVGDCTASWEYMEARIRFNMPELFALSDGHLEQVVVHELLHCVVAEMCVSTKEQAGHQGDHEERVVSMLTQSFGWLRDSAEKGKAWPLARFAPKKKRARRAGRQR